MKFSTASTLILAAAAPFIITHGSAERLGGPGKQTKNHGADALTVVGTTEGGKGSEGSDGHHIPAEKDQGIDDEGQYGDPSDDEGGIYDPDGIAHVVEMQMNEDWEDIMGYPLTPAAAPAEQYSNPVDTEKMTDERNNDERRLSYCHDNHNNCQYWASIGECSKNPGYMLHNCKRSCGQCSGSGSCSDNHNTCEYWASVGECSKNPGYMLSQCKKSCGQCSSSGTNPTGRKQQWLDAHNTRRQKYHSRYGKSYVPLKWSESVAVSAKNYANKLIQLSGCQIRHGYQGDDYGGENLAAHSSSSTRTPDSILQRWAEEEENKHGQAFSEWGHFTQVIWRGSKYVGCGEASKSGCSIQVCRYIAPGNCNAGGGSLSSAINKAMEHSSPCNPQCPAEGCF